jgi:hypothetical protein
MDATPNELLDERIAKRKRQNVERVLRCRKRKQAGSRCVRIEVTDWAETLDAFIKIGVLRKSGAMTIRRSRLPSQFYAGGVIAPSKPKERPDRDDNRSGNAVATRDQNILAARRHGQRWDSVDTMAAPKRVTYTPLL